MKREPIALTVRWVDQPDGGIEARASRWIIDVPLAARDEYHAMAATADRIAIMGERAALLRATMEAIRSALKEVL